MNDCKFTGRLTADPEVRTTQNGHRVVPFTLAVDSMQKNAGGQTQADFLRFEAWDNHADTIAKYCRKGTKLLISGAARAENYTDQNGNKRTKSFFLVRFLELPPKPPQAQQAQPSDQAQQIRKAPVDVTVTYDDDFAYYDEQELPF